jgi:ATP-dependent DNA helicase PIF1
VHIGGMTVHSFAGIGKGEDGIIDLKEKAKRTKRIAKHWTECRTLIIDEVSMVSPTSLFRS